MLQSMSALTNLVGTWVGKHSLAAPTPRVSIDWVRDCWEACPIRFLHQKKYVFSCIVTLPVALQLPVFPLMGLGLSLWWPFFLSILPNMDRGTKMISMEVSKDVPVPPDKRRYPYKVMEVGDSFFVDGGKLQVVCNNNYRTGKKLERKFIARCEKEGVRVWRTA